MSDAADARYTQVQTLAQAVVARVSAIWSGLDPAHILASLQGDQGAAILDAVVAGQLTAAQGAQAFVAQAMAERAAAARLAAEVAPEAFAGIASDGRPLTTLLFQPAITTFTTLAGGADPRTALLAGMNQMARMVSTQIADTSRAATQVSMVTHRRCIAYVRVVKLPACGRCLILAGRQYSYSTGFKRHPKCDCGMDPIDIERWGEVPSPEKLVAQMTPEEQRKRLGAAAVDALAKGADLAQVVNARRGMQTMTVFGRKVQATTEGSTVRGIAGKRLATDLGADKLPGQRYRRSKSPRLMPEEILRLADDREHQLRLLKKHGYIY
ncbi:VG15 protein [Streptomyces sp. P9-A2]|uniref:VG15 protein n=1 Tax=Streptomyces sp. P9-A2 TaxID=3072284 RepID=UPI002FCC8F66